MNYYVVMQDFGAHGLEAVVDPALDRQQIVDRIKTREFDNIVRIDHVAFGIALDVTKELIDQAESEIGQEVEAEEVPLPSSMVRPGR